MKQYLNLYQEFLFRHLWVQLHDLSPLEHTWQVPLIIQ